MEDDIETSMVRIIKDENKRINLQFFHPVLYEGMLLDRDIPSGARISLISKSSFQNIK